MRRPQTTGLRAFRALFPVLAVVWGVTSSGICLAAAETAQANDSSSPIDAPFQVLASYKVPDAMYKAKRGKVLGFVPASVRKLDGQRVILHGFMLPTKIKDRLATEFLLLRTQSTCCFGVPPELNEGIEIVKIDSPTKPIMDIPVKVVGRLHVRERWEGPYLCSIYQMEAETVSKE
jgi:hypothetical protein